MTISTTNLNNNKNITKTIITIVMSLVQECHLILLTCLKENGFLIVIVIMLSEVFKEIFVYKGIRIFYFDDTRFYKINRKRFIICCIGSIIGNNNK